MKTETLPHGLTLPKIGFGMWKIGGGTYPDPSKDAASLAAIEAALDVGYTHFDTAEMYARGHSEELLGKAIRQTGTSRSDVFITSKVHPSNLKFDDLITACENSLRRLETDYIDLYLIHWPGSVPLEESFRALNTLRKSGKIRHVGVSNFDVKLMKQASKFCETPIITNQVPYSLSERAYSENGVLGYCRDHDILLTAYSPVDEGRLRVREKLRTVAEKHNASPYQIAIAWLIQQPRIITIPMSMNPQHIAENFRAEDITLDEDDLAQLN